MGGPSWFSVWALPPWGPSCFFSCGHSAMRGGRAWEAQFHIVTYEAEPALGSHVKNMSGIILVGYSEEWAKKLRVALRAPAAAAPRPTARIAIHLLRRLPRTGKKAPSLLYKTNRILFSFLPPRPTDPIHREHEVRRRGALLMMLRIVNISCL